MARLELERGTDVLLLETGDALLLEFFFGIQVNEVAVDILKGSLMVDLRIEERSIAEFTIVDLLGTASFLQGYVYHKCPQ